MTPQRIQLKRSKGWRIPPNTLKVDRSSGFGNPFRVYEAKPIDGNPIDKPWWMDDGSHGARLWMFETKAEAVAAAVTAFRNSMTDLFWARARLALKGKNLACWCALPKEGEQDICHAAVLLEIANAKQEVAA